MAIRVREVQGRLVALCAARSVERVGDVYLDDGQHHALAAKFARDFNEEGWPTRGILIPNGEADPLVEREESNNPNREWWDRTYGAK